MTGQAWGHGNEHTHALFTCLLLKPPWHLAPGRSWRCSEKFLFLLLVANGPRLLFLFQEEAALLLCGLLLGFGLDAWVMLGRLRTGVGHTWVLTRGPLATPCFWEPATGGAYKIP